MLIGLIATILTTTSTLPQIYKVYKTKSANDLSMIQLVVLAIGVLCWLLYGIEIKDVMVITANSISLAGLITLISLKKLYDNAIYAAYIKAYNELMREFNE